MGLVLKLSAFASNVKLPVAASEAIPEVQAPRFHVALNRRLARRQAVHRQLPITRP